MTLASDAMDADSPKDELISLILLQRKKLVDELQGMKVMALHAKAVAVGVDAGRVSSNSRTSR